MSRSRGKTFLVLALGLCVASLVMSVKTGETSWWMAVGDFVFTVFMLMSKENCNGKR